MKLEAVLRQAQVAGPGQRTEDVAALAEQMRLAPGVTEGREAVTADAVSLFLCFLQGNNSAAG